MNVAESSMHGSVKKAIEWISIQRKMDPIVPLKKLINDAMLRFDLSPKDCDFLISFYRNGSPGEGT